MAFKKGDPKPPNSGIKKGTKHGHKRAGDLYSSLLEHGCDFDQIFAEALKSKDHAMIKVMIDAMPYLRPIYKAREAPLEESPENETLSAITEDSTESLLKSVANGP